MRARDEQVNLVSRNQIQNYFACPSPLNHTFVSIMLEQFLPLRLGPTVGVGLALPKHVGQWTAATLPQCWLLGALLVLAALLLAIILEGASGNSATGFPQRVASGELHPANRAPKSVHMRFVGSLEEGHFYVISFLRLMDRKPA